MEIVKEAFNYIPQSQALVDLDSFSEEEIEELTENDSIGGC